MKPLRPILPVILQAAAALAVFGCARREPAAPTLCGACDPAADRADRLVAAPCAGAAVTDDQALKRTLDHGAHTLMEAKKTTAVTELIKQLARPRCKLRVQRPAGRAKTPAQIYARCRDSVIIVAGVYKCTRCTKWHTRTTSGVLIHPAGVFLTNYHVINNTKNTALVAMTRDGKVYPVTEVLAASASDDVAVVRLDAGRRRLAALPISAGSPVGTPVTVISHPTNRFYLLTTGIISRYQKTRRAGKTAAMMTITADFARGSSGAPVLNDRGAVVGLVASTSSVYYPAQKPKKEQLQMVFKQCVPAESILKLIAPK